MSRSRATRVIRASVAASIATFVALFSHVAAGGAMPSWLGIAVPWVLSLAVCTVLVGRALSLPRLGVAVVLSQLLFHLLFVLGADSGAPAGTVATGHVHGLPVLDLSTGATPVAADLSMWFAHLAAAVLTVAALYRGERLVIRLGVLARELLAWVRRRILSGVVRLPAVAERPGIVCTPAAPLRSAPVVSLVRRRGPPLSFVV
ncbi:MAG: hypothetical protein DSY74_00920 [Actinobacteria bacterium]|uniref:hypothetical protein n=1 Tax=unclassified Microbacterium TaxID=2609290 RepID=UPI000C6713B2|nr:MULTISPECIES: hypothetical protein [unclassified Microbacterium]RUA27724.1 MAG: hypothetical protein DSY74_00920 [Actinomycetota bacterium]MBU20483.1 hypothetical protein [Microbacterium sp.]HAJ16857.1 hypothetical protein [Microbacterium sp.]HBS08177.1 hypothetical protein [Microbacterium sp.]HBU44124.1 hypothetical protein [Microbacterium sp.]|tara:strand:- start:325 stop:933 length:609 start_codon:yes stop_codon:yes gene_type:complete